MFSAHLPIFTEDLLLHSNRLRTLFSTIVKTQKLCYNFLLECRHRIKDGKGEDMLFDMHKDGWIEVICGPMFAGKTEELLRRVNRMEYAKINYRIFKPAIDNRYAEEAVVSHDGTDRGAIVVSKAKEILSHIDSNVQSVAIDEVQFFDAEVVAVCEYLANNGLRVIVNGLDMDFRGEPFPIMMELLARSEFITKLTAICMQCGAAATRSQRLIDGKPARYDDPIIQVGAAESYEARCRHCHKVEGHPNYIGHIGEINADSEH